MNTRKFGAGVDSGYAELPVKSNYGFWKRGDGTARHLIETDPAKFFGGWHFMVEKTDDKGSVIQYPEVPLPIVERMTDNAEVYRRYSWNYIDFMPLIPRERFELREKDTGKVLAVAKKFEKGVTIDYQPSQQVFGLAYADDGSWTPAVIKLDKWNSYISFKKAEQEFLKITCHDGQELVRRYGNIGEMRKVKIQGVLQEKLVPEFEEFGQAKSTPIRAIGADAPVFVTVTAEMNELYEAAKAWANCPRWNAVTKAAQTFAKTSEAMQEVDANPFGEDEEVYEEIG